MIVKHNCQCGRHFRVDPNCRTYCVCGRFFEPSKYVSEVEPSIRHCIYHIYASNKNDIWKKNIAKIKQYIDVFNGKKVCAIACDNLTVPYSEVEAIMSNLGFKCYEFPNDNYLREVLTFTPLLSCVKSDSIHEAIFYAHTKGNTTPLSCEGTTYWRNVMYNKLLGGYKECMKHLTKYKAVGTHKFRFSKDDVPYPKRESPRSCKQPFCWMFAGTYFWLRSHCIFRNINWYYVPVDRYGAESWLSGFIEPDSCHSVYQPFDENADHPNPYDPAIYAKEDREL